MAFSRHLSLTARDVTKFAFEFDNQLNKCALPNSLEGPKIILDMSDRHVSKDGPFRILGSALAYLLSDFFGITFLHFLS